MRQIMVLRFSQGCGDFVSAIHRIWSDLKKKSILFSPKWFLWLRILKKNVVYGMFSHDFLCTKVHYINPQVAVPVNTMDHNYCSLSAKNHTILSRDWVTIWQIREAMLCFWKFSLKIFLKLKKKLQKNLQKWVQKWWIKHSFLVGKH